MQGRGFAEIVVEAGICTSGSLEKLCPENIITVHYEFINYF